MGDRRKGASTKTVRRLLLTLLLASALSASVLPLISPVRARLAGNSHAVSAFSDKTVIIDQGILDDANNSTSSRVFDEPYLTATLIHPRRPVASFTFGPAEPVVNETITFDASGSNDKDGTILSYSWDFDDGTGQTEAEPKTQHFYKAPGLYYASLTVTDNDGLKGTVKGQVSVGKMPSTVSVFFPPDEIVIRENISISGVVTPERSEANITVWCRLDYEDWIVLANVATDVNSRYQYGWVPSRTGTYAVKASWTGDEYTLANESDYVKFNCLNISSSISIATTSTSTYEGYRVNVTGKLMDMYRTPLSNETVILSYTLGEITTWTQIASDNTDDSGWYSVAWIPPSTGNFLVKAEWAGNATHSAADGTMTVGTLSYNGQYVFTVESNSTISGLAFDTYYKTLSFTAAGTGGTFGYTRITVDKGVLPDIALLRVSVDGIICDYTSTETSNSWIILFTYPHSSHNIEVTLDSTIPELQTPFIVLLLVTTSLLLVANRPRTHALETTGAHATGLT